MDFGDVEKLANGEVRLWMGFGGTLKNVSNVTLTDLSVCVDLQYKGTSWKFDCGDVPDLAVGETRKHGVGIFLEGQPADIQSNLAASSYVTTVHSEQGDVRVLETSE